MASITIAELTNQHIRADFLNQHQSLEQYIKFYAKQDVKRNLCRCFVACSEHSLIVLGYYTLAAFSYPKVDVHESFSKKYGAHYKDIPLTLLGRLAVSTPSNGKGIGNDLLMDAIIRSYAASKTIGSLGIVANFIDNNAKAFYLKYGFIHITDSNYVILPFQDVEKNLSSISASNKP